MKVVKFVRSDENGGLREEAKLYAIGESDDCCWFKPSEVRDVVVKLFCNTFG